MQELDEELGASQKINNATKPGVGPDSETALESLSIGGVDVKGSARSTSKPAPKETVIEIKGSGARPGSRKALQEENETLRKENDDIKARLTALEARSNESAVDDLGAVIAMGISVSSQFIAEKRGKHWLFDNETESTPIGNAWALALAPYAEKIKEYAPWAVALGVTWMVVKPKLDEDKRLFLEKQGQTELPLNAD
jgi:hypothetical protein